MKTILVTGGAGFIGSHTCLVLLKKGFNVVIVDSFINSSKKVINKIKEICFLENIKSEKKINVFKCDLRDTLKLREIFATCKNDGNDIESVIHFAGLKSVNDSITFPFEYWDVNVSGTVSLLRVMNENNCKTLVFSSSAAIYKADKFELLKECSDIIPITPYGNTKAYIEIFLKDIFKSAKGEWKIANLRYFNPIGSHHTGLIGEDPKQSMNNIFPIILKVASKEIDKFKIFGNDWPTADKTCVRDYIHVMDVAEGHLKTLEFLSSNKSQVLDLNLGTSKGTSVLELIHTFQKVNNIKVPYVFTFRRDGDKPFVVANNQLAKKLLKWAPIRTLEDMCRDGWNYQKNN